MRANLLESVILKTQNYKTKGKALSFGQTQVATGKNKKLFPYSSALLITTKHYSLPSMGTMEFYT